MTASEWKITMELGVKTVCERGRLTINKVECI